MINVKDLLIDTLKEKEEWADFPIIQQGSMADDEQYPDHFFTFFNNESYDIAFYDNSETRTVWDFDLNFYSIDPALVNSVLREAKPLLKEKGFIVGGAGYDVISDEETHTGRGINVTYVEFL